MGTCLFPLFSLSLSLSPSHFPLLLMLFLCALRVLCGAKSFAFAPSSLYLLSPIHCFKPLDSRSKDLWNDEDGTCLFPLFSLSLSPSHFPLLLMLFLCALRVLCGAKSFAPSSLYSLATIYFLLILRV